MKKILAMMAMTAGFVAAQGVAPVAAPSAGTTGGELNQRARIRQGVRDGSLTRGEAARLRGRENRLQRRVARDRAANGGKLTPGEQRRVQQQENRNSRAIQRLKNNGRKK